jgi:uncharacterized RDD family membrane protein YckC
MKCPKCAYLGFDTSERCRNCGYDFSLIAAEEPAADLSLRFDTDGGAGRERQAFDPPLKDVPSSARHATALDVEPIQPPPSFRGDPSLPLFGTTAAAGDEPLIKVPARPRAPLAVRRTPDLPKLRAAARAIERPVPDPVLDFTDEPAPTAAPEPAAAVVSGEPAGHLAISGAGARLFAALIDHLILFSIDGIVLYLTLRIASLTFSDWNALPLLPLVVFLGLLKLSYFTAFTCVGGQTIGKMAAGIRVVNERDQGLDAPHAVHRALAGAVSFVTLGAGFLPALLGPDHLALHDRIAHTRVVVLRAA